MDENLIRYSGVSEIILSAAALELTFDLSNLTNVNLVVGDDDEQNDGRSVVNIPGLAISFIGPLEILRIETGDGDDDVVIRELDTEFEASIVINTGSGNDTINIETAIPSFTLNGGAGNDSLSYPAGTLVAATSVAPVIYQFSVAELVRAQEPVELSTLIGQWDEATAVSYEWSVMHNDQLYFVSNAISTSFTPHQAGKFYVHFRAGSGEDFSVRSVEMQVAPSALVNSGPIDEGSVVDISFAGMSSDQMEFSELGFRYSYARSAEELATAEITSDPTWQVLFARAIGRNKFTCREAALV